MDAEWTRRPGGSRQRTQEKLELTSGEERKEEEGQVKTSTSSKSLRPLASQERQKNDQAAPGKNTKPELASSSPRSRQAPPEEDEAMQEGQEEEESSAPRVKKIPKLPNQKEREEREATHLPSRTYVVQTLRDESKPE